MRKKKFEIQNLTFSIDLELNRVLKKYSRNDSPKDSADEIKLKFDKIKDDLIKEGKIKKAASEKEFLKNLIRIIERFNVFVFEYIKHPAKKAEINFNGFFMNPNMIVLNNQKYINRRNSKSFRD